MEQRRTTGFMHELLREGQRNAHLPILIGIALMLSGWLAALTTVGAQFIYAGAALVLGGTTTFQSNVPLSSFHSETISPYSVLSVPQAWVRPPPGRVHA
jgi:hypothetical protein